MGYFLLLYLLQPGFYLLPQGRIVAQFVIVHGIACLPHALPGFTAQ